MSFVLSNLHMNNVSNDVVSTIFLLILKYNGNHQYNTRQTEMLQYFIAEQTFLNI